MSGDRNNRSFSESLILDNSEEGVVITGITDDRVAARSGLQAGDEIVAATIHLDHLNKNEVLNILKVLEPYDNNMKVLTKKQLDASADLGSFGFGLKDPAKMLNLKKDLSLDASAQAPVVSLDGLNGKLNAAHGLGGGMGGPTLNGDLPGLSLNKSSADAGANFTMPSLGLTGPDVKGDGYIKAPNVSVSTPTLNTPNASLNSEKPGLKTGDLKYKAPLFSMPNFNFPQAKTPKANMDVSSGVDLPSFSGNLNTPNLNQPTASLDLKSPDWHLKGPNGDMNGADINFETSKAEIEAPSSKIKWPHQKWKGPKVKGPDADLNTDLPAPDFSLTTPKIDGDLSAPDVDINLPKANIKSPDLDINRDIDTPSSKFHWPHKWKKTKLHGPKADLDLDAHLNTPNVDPSLPKVEGGINGPDVDINLSKADLDVQSLDIDGEAPFGKITWPHKKWKKPKLQGPKADINADLNTPDLNFSTPKIEGDINVPNTELNLPKADLNGPNVDFPATDLDMDAKQINWPHLKWKKPKLHSPKVDLSSPDVDLSVPKIEGEISTPDMDLNLPKADVEVKAPDGKIRFPTLKKPKFLLPGAKVKSPDVDLDANVKAPELNLSPKASFDGPNVDLNLPRADLKGPELDINAPDLDGSGKLKWFNFKKPKFGTLKGPKGDVDVDLKVPDMDLKAVDVNMSAPKIEGGIETPDLNIGNVSAPNVDLKAPNLNLSAPNIGFNAPDLDLNVPKADLKCPHVDLQAPEVDASAGKIKLPKINLPKFGLSGPKVKGPNLNVDADNVDFPDVNLDLPTADVKAPNLNLPSLKGDLRTPDLGLDVPKADLKGPDIDLQAPVVDASAGKIKLPKINLPKFGLSGPKVKGPNLNVDPDVSLDLPTADVKAPNLNLPSLKGDLSTPDLDADLKTGFDLSTPNTNISVPDINLSTPNIKGPHVNLNLPKADVKGTSLDLPKADLQVPDLNLNAPDLSLSSPKIYGNLSAPKTELKAPVTLKSPNMDINLPKADLKLPDAQLKTPDLDLDSNLGDFNFPHFKVPKLGLSSPEVEVPSVHPSVEAGIEAPNINIGTPMGAIEGPEVTNVDADLKKPKFSNWKFPKLSLPGHKIEAGEGKTSANLEFSPDVKIKTPSVEGGISSPAVSVSAPEVKTSLNTPELDITAKADAEVEGSPKSKSRWPFKWGLHSSSVTNEERSCNDSETDVSNGDVAFPVFKTHKLPRNSLGGIGGIEDILSLSKLDTEAKDYVVSKGIRLPIINTNAKAGGKIDIMERLKMAKEKTHSTNVSPTDAKTDIDLKLSAPSLDVSTLKDADSSLVRGGTFKVEKPESALGLVAPEISTSDENDKLSLSLSNMLGLNIKD